MSRKKEEAVFRFEPRTKAQAEAARLYESADVLLLLGGAGCGKTHLAMALAVQDVLQGRRERIVLTRPVVEAAGERLGYLKGNVEEKLAPYQAPVEHVLGKMVFRFPPELLEVVPLAFLRGRTFEKCVCVLDEAQNATLPQLRLYLSRLGPGAKMILAGDPHQSDVRPTRADYDCDLAWAADRLEGLPGVAVYDFPAGATVRHRLLTPILARLQ